MKNTIQVKTNSILQIPLSKYEKNFLFVVNGEEFYTSYIVADLLSPRICMLRNNDPSINQYIINTRFEGNFNDILNLFNFDKQQFSSENLPYVFDIFDQLGTTNIDVNIFEEEEITNDNVLSRIKYHENKKCFNEKYEEEIEYLSLHFDEILSNDKEEIKSLSDISIEKVLINEHLTLSNEDSLLSLINELYSENHQLSNLYEYVLFNNVETDMIKEFYDIFDFNYLTSGAWASISQRLLSEININKSEIKNNTRYNRKKATINISYSNKEFDGIINYLKKESNIKEEIDITFSSDNNNGINSPFNLIEYDDPNKIFVTQNIPNSWICIEFKKHKIIPSNYTIQSNPYSNGYHHPKSWIIEGSNDKNKWIRLSEENNTSILNGESIVGTFPIKNKTNEEFKYIRIQQTSPNCGNCHYFYISSIEIYGKLI